MPTDEDSDPCDTPCVASDNESLPVLPGFFITSLDEAIRRFEGAAKLHADMEPSLLCRRAPDGRRRWELTVNVRRKHEHQDQGATPEG